MKTEVITTTRVINEDGRFTKCFEREEIVDDGETVSRDKKCVEEEEDHD